MRWMVNGGADSNKSSSRSTHSAASGSPLAAASDGGAAAASRSPAGVGAPASPGGRLSTCDDVVAPSSAAKSANARIISPRIPTRSGSQRALRCCAREVRVRLCEPGRPALRRTTLNPPQAAHASGSLPVTATASTTTSSASKPEASAPTRQRAIAPPARRRLRGSPYGSTTRAGRGGGGGRGGEGGEGRTKKAERPGVRPLGPSRAPGTPGDGQRSLQQAGGSLVTACTRAPMTRGCARARPPPRGWRAGRGPRPCPAPGV